MSVRLRYAVDGPADAPTVVLANSLGATWSMWDHQLEALTQRYRVIRYDARGHGDSPAPTGPYSIDDLTDDVVALLDQIGAGRVHFVGLSLGGMTGLRLAARHPGRVDRLVVLCTSALLGPAAMWADRAALVRAQGTAAVADAVVARWYTKTFREAHPDVIATAAGMVASTATEGYAACCEAIATMDLTTDLPTITAPTLAIAGADDPATPPEHLEAITAAIPTAHLLVVPDAAHLAPAEQPAPITAAILDHLGTAIMANQCPEQRSPARLAGVTDADAGIDTSAPPV
ncbi:3-oxoadipate enol-lactonase [Kribbella sp. VKM Ac-2527]|uniref:3-oxoadipate enol-lactonase n=1 Tax=Kribbella caucasensis TaxID=2512215 RepID=A0A4R6KA39_9ACTN|nr:3-oxoadipate enol-lactonase [Kribbella sp. VKM Ac-2527]TDO46655.1 3-oxoadipate enol-lactonase [Kribbella sp. VKM Ac-2527]